MGIGAPTAVQAAALPGLQRDLSRPVPDAIIHSETGSGKTLTYLLPILSRLEPAAAPGARLRAIVCVPTRELAHQVADVAASLGETGSGKVAGRALRVLKAVGDITAQTLFELKESPPHIIVGTPHTLSRLVPTHVNTGELHALVLDEADELLRVHNVAAVRALAQHVRSHKARPGIICVSATSSFSLEKFTAERKQQNAVSIDLTGGSPSTPKTLRHTLVRVPRPAASFNTFTRMLAALRPMSTLSFHNSAAGLEALEVHLRERGVRCGVLGAAYSGEQRARAMGALATGRVTVLLATEMGARGLDLPRLSHVVNFDPPSSLREYVHRAGRVGRLSSKAPGRIGTVVNFAFDDQSANTYAEFARSLGVGLDDLRFEAGEPVTTTIVEPRLAYGASRC
jgi:superfamily II DNA/RNA helicase